MKYEELKRIAETHIRTEDNIPSNAFLLLSRLHINFKNEIECKKDFSKGLNPLYNTPAFYDKNTKTIYFNSKSKYWNFYIFHEISHYLLGHESNNVQNEADANMLACILSAPEENLPSNLKSARDLSCIGNIPIDRAEEYWQKIKFKKRSRARLFFIIIIVLICCLLNFNNTNLRFVSNMTNNVSKTVYVTNCGKKYNLNTCIHIRKSDSAISLSIDEAKKLGYTSCAVCIGK